MDNRQVTGYAERLNAESSRQCNTMRTRTTKLAVFLVLTLLAASLQPSIAEESIVTRKLEGEFDEVSASIRSAILRRDS